jgi:hypothetical protein
MISASVMALLCLGATPGDLKYAFSNDSWGRLSAAFSDPTTATNVKSMMPVTITAGHRATNDSEWLIPKKDLIGVLQILLQSKRVQFAASLPVAPILVDEMMDFRVKVTTATENTVESWRERDHDDLVLALAVAAWLAERHGLPQEAFVPYVHQTAWWN